MHSNIIQSILDNDFYKFTMQQGVVRLFPYARAKYGFINRGKHYFPPGFAARLQEAVNKMAGLSLTREEKQFLRITCPYLDPVYLDFLEGYRFDPDEVVISQDGESRKPGSRQREAVKFDNRKEEAVKSDCRQGEEEKTDTWQGQDVKSDRQQAEEEKSDTYQVEELKSDSQQGGDLQVHIEGLWYRTILWEVPLMSLISELYYEAHQLQRVTDAEVIERTANKISKYRGLGVTVAEFGTRRRHSYDVHHLVMQSLRKNGEGVFIGSSNVHMAMMYNTKPIGTHAHEWFMFHAARYGFQMANIMGLEHWVQVYRGDLGIALSDTYTTAVFFKQFDKMFSKLFDGVRHDSGDPLTFADMVIDHYKSLGIDPLSKSIIFSDGLNYDKVARIVAHCRGKIRMSFGIGTNLTNDVGPGALNIVIKMTAACPHAEGWIPVVKLSDEHGKYTGDEHAITLAKQSLGLI
jgi:nicotinate phosphoribosyltransferase